MMATLRQKKLVSKLSDNIRTKGELLRQAGYSVTTSLRPQEIINSRGVQELIAKGELKGITDDYNLDIIKKAIEGRDLNLAVNTIWRWWNFKYPDSKDNPTNVNLTKVEIVLK